MATIKIGGRELNVKPATVGFWIRAKEMAEAVEKKQLDGGQIILASVEQIYEAVAHNDGVTLKWVQDNAPFPPAELYGQVLTAAGLRGDKAEDTTAGEAKTQ